MAGAKKSAKKSAKRNAKRPASPRFSSSKTTAPRTSKRVDVEAIVAERVSSGVAAVTASLDALQRRLDQLAERVEVVDQAPAPPPSPSLSEQLRVLFGPSRRAALTWQIQVKATEVDRALVEKAVASQVFEGAPRYEVMRRLMWAGAIAMGLANGETEATASSGAAAGAAAA